jgi:cytochrome oxidase Cu insertion factor (SCO1/SenC/PrrC family)
MGASRIAIIVSLLLAVAAVGGCGGSGSTSTATAASQAAPGPGSAGPGTQLHLPVPAALEHLALTNQHGKTVSLGSWPGKTVLLVPFLSLCQDVCPLITGNLLTVQQSLRSDHAAADVQIVELSVDPQRDTPARLAAYAKLTGGNWQFVTESPADLRRLAKFFGFYYAKVPEDHADAVDWWTGKHLTYDVDHSDNYFVIDPKGIERVENDAAPDFHGKLNRKLYDFLDALGHEHLVQAPQPNWTPADLLQALAVTVGRPLPASTL